tara:strand:- start:6426 stop:7088 length:663 start_codon:yes stop_codon:yes gene_type:complete
VFDWLAEMAPDPLEHDYVLYTDGSGCVKGWGGYAAVIQKIDMVDGTRAVVDARTIVNGTYGSTVQRCEMNAFLDGVHSILSERAGEVKDAAKVSQEELYHIAEVGGALNCLSGADRPTILWYNDRANIAQALLFDVNGDALHSRNKDRDLWMRWSMMARHACITPMCRPRNTIEGQATCDALAGEGRKLMMGAWEAFASHTQQIHPTDKWQKKKPQSAHF